MNSIPTEQNTDRQIMRLAAQRQLYATAKRIFGFQIFISGPIAVTFSVISITYPAVKPYAALWGIFVVLADVIWLTPWIKRLREHGAKVQELFDCDVLSLIWSELKAGNRPDPELIKEQADRYANWGYSMPPLKNWYNQEVGELPIHIARVACQRSNCWWDSEQRRRYAFFIITTVIIIFLLVFLSALGRGFTIEDFILRIIAPLAPILVLGIRQYNEQIEAAVRSTSLKGHAERIWKSALENTAKSKIEKSSRDLQNEIFESRKKSPLVFDFIFKGLRNNYELQMNHGVSELVSEAKKKLGLG